MPHFRLFDDNADRALVHARLLPGMLLRLRRRLYRSGAGMPGATEPGR